MFQLIFKNSFKCKNSARLSYKRNSIARRALYTPPAEKLSLSEGQRYSQYERMSTG